MASTMTFVFSDDVPGDRQGVISFFDSLSVPLRRLHALAARATRDAEWPMKSAIWTLRL